MFELGVIDLE
jgi:Ion transport protein